MKTIREIAVFIATISTSMIGSSLLGISLNKLGLIPLLFVLFIELKGYRFTLTRSSKVLVVFLMFSIVSSLFSLSAPYADNYHGYYSDEFFLIIQILVIYLPILFFLSASSKKTEYFCLFTRSIKVITRLNLLWAFAQFFAYEIFRFDINAQFLGFLYEKSFGGQYTSTFIYVFGIGRVIRCTGLNYDPAYFGILMVLGFIIDKNILLKIMYFLVSLLAMSRSAIVTIAFLCIVSIFKGIYKFFRTVKITKRKIILSLIFMLPIVVILFCFINSPIILGKLNILKDRFNIFEVKGGTARHLYYPIYAIDVLINKYNIFQAMFGFGPRASGTILINFLDDTSLFPEYMFNSMFATECDISELILGRGLIGFGLYYYFLFLLFKNMVATKKEIPIAIVLFGIMYNLCNSTFIILLLIFLSAGLYSKREINVEGIK